MKSAMIKTAHHWGVCNTFELELEVKGVSKKFLKKMMKLLGKNSLFGQDAQYFWPDALNVEQEKKWKEALANIKQKLVQKAKNDGKTDIFTNMAKQGYEPGGLIIAPQVFGAEGSKVLDAFTSGQESASEVMQESALIAFVNTKTGEVKFAGQSGLDIKSGSSYAIDADKKIMKPSLKKAMAAVAVAQAQEAAQATGMDFKIQYDEQSGKVSVKSSITNANFSDALMPTYNEENGIQQKIKY